VPSFKHPRPAGKTREAADDREVVRIHAVTVQFLEFVENRNRVVERIGAVRVTRDHHLLHRREIREKLAREAPRLFLEPLQLGGELGVARGQFAKLAHAVDQVDDVLFEGEDESRH